MGWCRNVEPPWKSQVVLLTAVAGAGKSTVAHTIAHQCTEHGILLSTFFFRARETASPDHLWSGVARSLAIRSESHRAILTTILENDPTIATAAFDEQFSRLVLESLCRLPPPDNAPLIIIIDALDECDEGASETLAKLLRDKVPMLPRTVKIFVTSRHTRVVDNYLLKSSSIQVLNINLLDNENLQDCEVYIRSQVSELKGLRPAADWSPDLQQRLSERAHGLFVWVSTVMDYVKNKSVNPLVALEALMEGTSRDNVPAEENLDALYTAILKKCNWRDPAFKHNYPIVMDAVLAAKLPLSMDVWDALLSPLLFRKTSVEDTLSELRPLFTGTDRRSTPIQLLHQSFGDYLKWRITKYIRLELGPVMSQEWLALRCFQVINTEIQEDTALGIIERLGERDLMPTISRGDVSQQLAYACHFGLDHALEAKDVSKAFKMEIKKFLEGSIIRWLEFCVRTKRYISIYPFFDWIEVG